ncbi:CRISPR system precrRNA processing endoribonuclease RAMP protein Cas6 [Anabaenopsis elenkinii]|uniref:CRISPR system precrRNA processing endoribonuclease RAMP protein Cas6 n=1 Tax=Anabaenopsis elenkinii CCIBt3563 TaxID=2779889 RepID=A0A7S6U6K5_9CYAN|nr:CRISPR system precrRNA processing endoribonuclease RAMP protein Cas6 [Anabaenopsis elenkinii]QOV23819.1 CRISPR system precrRNA processing endoribonuclease RAMP protein Cas6 [Anabaenopsis elenkinii CCIBt3563]
MEQEPLSLPHKSTTLHSIVVELAAVESGYLPATLSRALHALVLQWLSGVNPSIAEFIHQTQYSPLTISGLLGNRRQGGVRVGDYFYFRIGLLDGNLIEPLMRGFEQSETKSVVLAQFPFVLRNLYAIPGTHQLAGAADYTLLSNPPQVLSDIELHFLSPTSFKQNQTVQTFPLPELVFNSLLRRWNFFAPEQYHFASCEWNAVVTAYELKTYALKMEGGAEVGGQGWVNYRFSDMNTARIATILANFAFFAGVGRKTAMGMGQTQLVVQGGKDLNSPNQTLKKRRQQKLR